MNLASVLLGAAALILTFAGILATPIPFLGTVLSFLAPVAALAGLIVGGVAMSRARAMGESDGVAIGGMITSGVALVPALLVSITCGLCNTVCSGAMLRGPDRSGGTFSWPPDAGASAPRDVGAVTPPTPEMPGTRPASLPGEAPPPAFPPPPVELPAPGVGAGAPSSPASPVPAASPGSAAPAPSSPGPSPAP